MKTNREAWPGLHLNWVLMLKELRSGKNLAYENPWIKNELTLNLLVLYKTEKKLLQYKQLLKIWGGLNITKRNVSLVRTPSKKLPYHYHLFFKGCVNSRVNRRPTLS